MATYWENSCSFGLRYVSWYKYLIVSLVFSHLGFWSGNLFLIAPFPDLCLLVPLDQTGLPDSEKIQQEIFILPFFCFLVHQQLVFIILDRFIYQDIPIATPYLLGKTKYVY